jgi:sigma-B regulation protein RsbU (phosphoserine phosphatase)
MGLEERFCAGADVPCFSILYGIIDFATGDVVMARAGLPHPLVQRSDGSAEIVTVQAHLSGKGDSRRFTEHRAGMQKGDRLFIFSDGLVDCASSDMEQFSGARLISLLEGSRESGLDETIAAIDAELVRWRGREEFDDDVCLMAIQFE